MSDKNPSISTLPSVINQAIESKMVDLHTSTPGIVDSFDAETQTASVQPAIRRIFKTLDGENEILVPTDLPLLINVPVIFPRGGGFSLTFPVKEGDECLLVFCERSIDNWHTYGGVKRPISRRFHSLSDAVCHVGLSSIPNKIPNYSATDVQIRKDDEKVYITLAEDETLYLYSEGKTTVESADSVDVKAPTVLVDASTSATIKAPTITLDGNVVITGSTTAQAGMAVTGALTNNAVNVGSTHTHTQADDSAGDTQSPTGVPS